MDQQHVSFSAQPPPPPPPNQQLDLITKPKKLRRISRACDFCHKRSIRCKPSTEDAGRCQNCVDFGVGCTYNRPAKKRGIKTGSSKSSSKNGGSPAQDGERDARMLLELTNGSPGNGILNVVDRFEIPEKWKSMVLDNDEKIRQLVEVYIEIVYPIFPLFHIPSLNRRVSNRDYLTNHSFFADIMAICAIASARARDGALFPGRWDEEYFKNPSSETFFAAAKELMPQDFSSMRGLDWMRTCALLALYGIQVGNIDVMHQYLGVYHSLVSMDKLHDEKNWPKNIGIVETELRRRLFWSMYSLEVYSSIIWGGAIRCREAQYRVSFTSEIDDEFFSDSGYRPSNSLIPSFVPQPQTLNNPMCWLHGWNFTTRLYRILEHAMDDFHRRRPSSGNPSSPSNLFQQDKPQQSAVLREVMKMHSDLPPQFKEAALGAPNGPGNMEYRFSFQAANITATLQLARMVLFTSEDATVEQKCVIARDLLQSFEKVPTFFLRAISCPLLHHLAGIGSILGSVIEGPVSEPSYEQVRAVLLAMANLLGSLENSITRKVGAAARLRKQISDIDNFMAAQRQSNFVTNGATYPPPISAPSLGQRIKDEPNPNIDPNLQSELPPAALGVQDGGFAASVGVGTYGYENGTNGYGNGDAQSQFQLPQELLDNFPYNAGNIAQGFMSGVGGGFSGFQNG